MRGRWQCAGPAGLVSAPGTRKKARLTALRGRQGSPSRKCPAAIYHAAWRLSPDPLCPSAWSGPCPAGCQLLGNRRAQHACFVRHVGATTRGQGIAETTSQHIRNEAQSTTAPRAHRSIVGHSTRSGAWLMLVRIKLRIAPLFGSARYCRRVQAVSAIGWSICG